MNIGIFTNNYLPNPYGVSTSVDGFRRGLTERGHDVWVMAPEWRGSEGEVDDRIIRYPSVDVPTKVPFSLALPFSQEIDTQISELSFDVIHAQHPNILGAQALRWARAKGVPLVFTWHSLYDRYAHYAPAVVPEKFAARWAMQNAQTFAHAADHIIFPTRSVYEAIGTHEFPEEKVSIIPSGVDEELFAGPEATRIRSEFSIPESAPLIVSISRLTEEKNVLFLARAVVRFLRDHADAYFVFAGDGDLADVVREIAAEVSERVVLAGRIERSDVKHYLAAADLFVYASTSETQGTILTETLYSGTPIVAVDSQGVRDIVESEVGILTQEDEEEFAHAVRKLMGDREVLSRYAKNAHTVAREKYTIDICSAQLEAVYKSLTK